MINRFIFFLVVLQSMGAVAQGNIPVGTWRYHFSPYDARQVVKTDQHIVINTGNQLVQVEETTGEVSSLSELDGLSGGMIEQIAYHPETDQLIVGYASGLIELVGENELVRITAIRDDASLNDKQIRHISISQNQAFISIEAGIVRVDLQLKDIVASYLNLGATGNPLPILETTVWRDTLFAVTQTGVIAGPLKGGVILEDFNNWIRWGAMQGLPVQSYTQIDHSTSGVYAASINQDIFVYRDGLWETAGIPTNGPIRELQVEDQTVQLFLPDSVLLFPEAGASSSFTDAVFVDLRDGLFSDGSWWLADQFSGLIRYRNDEAEPVPFSGPVNDQIFRLRVSQGKVFAFPRAYTSGFLPLTSPAEFAVFEQGRWLNYSSADRPGTIPLPSVNPVTSVTLFPDQSGYFTSFGSGLLAWDGATTFSLIDDSSPGSELVPGPGPGPLRLTDIQAGADGALWITQAGSSISLYKLLDSDWESFVLPAAYRQPEQVIPATSGFIWVRQHPQAANLWVFDPDESSSLILNSSAGTGNLPGNRVYSIDEEDDGVVWAATHQGIAFFPTAAFIFSTSNPDGVIPIVDNRLLLDGDPVNAVTVDPANRIWIGTNQGAWLYDPDLALLVHQFTTDNSPLPGNRVADLAVDPETGEVFIATDGGLASFRADATEPSDTHAEVHIFPNPVRPEFTGRVGIEGLVANATVKITDTAGRLVWQALALGGSVSWDTRDLQGRPVKSGIYLVLSSDPLGEEAYVGKIAVIR